MFRIERMLLDNGIRKDDYKRCSSDIQAICDEYAKINFAFQDLDVRFFGVKENLLLTFCNDHGRCVKVYCKINGHYAYCGEKNMSEISNLYDFLRVLYTEQKIGGIDVMKILLDTSKTY